MPEEVVKFNLRGSVAEVILTRPEQYNAFNNKLRKNLPELLGRLEKIPNLRVVILKGSGPGFTAGADLNEGFPAPISKHLKDDYKPIFDKILTIVFGYIFIPLILSIPFYFSTYKYKFIVSILFVHSIFYHIIIILE